MSSGSQYLPQQLLLNLPESHMVGSENPVLAPAPTPPQRRTDSQIAYSTVMPPLVIDRTTNCPAQSPYRKDLAQNNDLLSAHVYPLFNAVKYWEQASKLGLKGLNLRQKVLGSEHPDTTQSLQNVEYFRSMIQCPVPSNLEGDHEPNGIPHSTCTQTEGVSNNT
ncbi:15444_t:CDS:2 [Acaulospora colombiana]|uniref:15444_t:CDS:1 n=1 Tax=Acaulospora colombiana TaxID=27376 RepID=A0ACA9NK47_9GLOM|nr:15444_t:CDS:2 [Acaulospora colombiana]